MYIKIEQNDTKCNVNLYQIINRTMKTSRYIHLTNYSIFFSKEILRYSEGVSPTILLKLDAKRVRDLNPTLSEIASMVYIP